MATIPLLLMTIHTLLPMLQGKVINIVTIDERVNLTCQPNSSIEFTWSLTPSQGVKNLIFTCDGTVNSQCVLNTAVLTGPDFTASWNGIFSVLSFLRPKISVETYSCEQSGDELRTYSVAFVDPDDIRDPVCNVAASSQDGDLQVTLSCEYNISQGELLDVVLGIDLEGTGKTSSTKPSFSPNITANLDYDTFLNITNALCILTGSGAETSLNRSCQYPKAVNIEKTIEGNDIAMRCDVESNSEVTWIVYDSDGSKIDTKNTSWTRDGGRSLLIRGVPSNHLENKVVECKTYRNGSKSMIGYTTISTLVNENTDDKVPLIPTPESKDNIFFVPALLFLTLWLITATLFGVSWWCGPMKNKPSSPSSISSIPGTTTGQTPVVNRPSTVGSNTNGEDSAHGTPLANIETHSHIRAMSYNLNNSAHNPSFAAGNVGRDTAQLRSSHHSLESNNLGNESQLYFTLEQSSPSPMNSLPRSATARWKQPDTNPVSLNHPQRQSSHSQCYETVGEPNKGATCSYDLGEYAEVGYGKGPPDLGEYAEVGVPFQGKRPPDLSGRPSIRKKPGREKVKEDDISRLYSKVNK